MNFKNSFNDDTELTIAESQDFQTVDHTDRSLVDQFAKGVDPDDALLPANLPFHKNPWVRIAIAVGAVAFALGFGSIFMIGGGKEEVANTSEPEEAKELTLSLEGSAQDSEMADGDVDSLKSEVALLEQQIAMAQIARGEEANIPRDPAANTPDSVTGPQRSPSRTASSTSSRPSSLPTSRAQPTPVTRPASSVTQRTPVSRPISVSSRAQPSRPAPVSAVPVSRAPAPSTPTALDSYTPPDPQDQWVQASNAGVMGAMPVMATEDSAEVAAQAEPVSQEYRLKGVDSAVEPAVSKEAVQYEEALYTASSDVPGLIDAGPVVVPMGQGVPAIVKTPITWINDNDQFLLELDADVVDSQGYVAIPAGSNIIVQPMALDDNTGQASLAVVGVQIDGQTYELDYQAFSVTGQDGPLIATEYGDVSGQIASSDFEMIAIGALRGIGEELIRPDSETITNSAYGSTTSRTNGDTSILGAVLAGGTGELSDRMADRNDRRLDEIRSRGRIFYLPEGEEVRVYINEDFSF